MLPYTSLASFVFTYRPKHCRKSLENKLSHCVKLYFEKNILPYKNTDMKD